MALDDFQPEAEFGAVPDLAAPAAARPSQSEDLFDFPLVVAFAEEEPAPRGQPLPTPGHDEDLFDDSSLESSLDRATESVAGLLASQDASAGRSANARAPRRTAPAGNSERPGLRRVPASAPLPLAARAGSPALWVLAAAALLLNAGLFTFLWQTSRTFEAALLEVRAERALPLEAPALPPSPESGRSSAVESILSPRLDEHAGRRAQQPVAFEPPEEVALRLAREEIAAGRPADARRRLFAVLATLDGLERTRRGPIEARASFLVAESFLAQSDQDLEGRP